MKKCLLFVLAPAMAVAVTGPQITIYNDGFATVKDARVLAVEEGVSEARVTDMSRQLEPDSVILRELGAEPFGLRILEQSFINDPLTERLMLHQFEGQTVRFHEKRQDGTVKEHAGKVIRSGYVPGEGAVEEPIIALDGGVVFDLPGQPVFEGIDAGAFLKPSLVWHVGSERAGNAEVEISYITAGMGWEATYSLIAPAEDLDEFDVSGWISLKNETGITFEDASLKLIAGDVQRARPPVPRERPVPMAAYMDYEAAMPEQRAFDEFHLYTLPRPVLLRNNELKQVEFVRASGVKGNRYYVYNPMTSFRYHGGIQQDPDYGITYDKKVGVRIEIENSAANNLGVPLPRGKIRLYRTDEKDGRRELTGENEIDHLPKDEWLKLDMGTAFDLVGERKRTAFRVDSTAKTMSETVEIRLRNRKESTAVEIRVIEPMYRGSNWTITSSSLPHTQFDAQTVEFRAAVPAGGETVLTYSVRYSW